MPRQPNVSSRATAPTPSGPTSEVTRVDPTNRFWLMVWALVVLDIRPSSPACPSSPLWGQGGPAACGGLRRLPDHRGTLRLQRQEPCQGLPRHPSRHTGGGGDLSGCSAPLIQPRRCTDERKRPSAQHSHGVITHQRINTDKCESLFRSLGDQQAIKGIFMRHWQLVQSPDVRPAHRQQRQTFLIHNPAMDFRQRQIESSFPSFALI